MGDGLYLTNPPAEIRQAEPPEETVRSRKPLGLSWKDGFWAAALVVLASCQIAQGTDLGFTALVLAFSVLWLITIRVVGGLSTLTGMCVGYLGFQHVVFSQFAKALMWQRPDTPLLEPIQTMQVYCVGLLGVFSAAVLLNLPPFRKVKPLLNPQLSIESLKVMAYACTALMLVRYLGSPQIGIGGIRFLMNFEFITAMASACTAAWVVQESGGKKFINWLSFFNIGAPFLVAIIGFQRREAIFAGVIMVAVAIYYGFRFQPKHYLTGLGLIYFFQFVFFPFALYYRNSVKRTANIAANLSQAWEALAEVLGDPLKYQEDENFKPPDSEWEVIRMQYYNREPKPTLDRLSILIVTDALLNAADQETPMGWETIMAGWMMLVPSVFNDNKDIKGTSNWIAQKAPGAVNDLDPVTQITMGIFGEMYMSFRWLGVYFGFLVASAVVFFVLRFGPGDSLKHNFWAVAWIVNVPWTYSEGTVQQMIILFLQAMPLYVASGLLMRVIANSLGRGVNRQQERLDDLGSNERVAARLAG